MVSEAIEQRGCQLGVAEHLALLAETQVGGDDDAGVQGRGRLGAKECTETD